MKAADELIERSRAHLFKSGRADKAARLLGARFGTVNSICGQIVGEHAIDLGRSPRAEVIPEDGVSRLFAIAADTAIERHAPALNALADAMGFFEPKRAADAERSDWRSTVRRLIELARANGLGAAGLAHSADRSVETFLALLPEPSVSAEALDNALHDAVGAALAVFPAELGNDGKAALKLLRPIRAAPLSALPLLLAVESGPDLFRTLGNVTADLAVVRIVGRPRPADETVSSGPAPA